MSNTIFTGRGTAPRTFPKTIFAPTHLNSTSTLPPVADGRGQSPVPVILPRHDQAIGSAAEESVVLTTPLEQQLAASIIIAGIKKDLAAGRSLHLVPPPARDLGGLPAELYYTGTEFAVPLKPMQPIDETRPLTPSDRDARAMAAKGRAGMIRFFAGRWSRRLGRVVRPA